MSGLDKLTISDLAVASEAVRRATARARQNGDLELALELLAVGYQLASAIGRVTVRSAGKAERTS
jgi:hypothetical protein